MQIFRSLASLVTEQDAHQADVQEMAVASEPQEIDESLLAQISGGTKAPGNGW